MPKKYHIHTKAAPLDLEYLFKFRIVRGENCINCGKCTKVCIYEAHKRRKDDPRRMADPNTVVCRNCFRCIQECPRGALEKSIGKDFSDAGGAFWKPDMLLSLWKQAEDGKVPVSALVTAGHSPERGSTACGLTCPRSCARPAMGSTDGSISAPPSISVADSIT